MHAARPIVQRNMVLGNVVSWKLVLVRVLCTTCYCVDSVEIVYSSMYSNLL